MGPVGYAEYPDLAIFTVGIQSFNILLNRSIRIIAVQQIDIDVISAQSIKALSQLLTDDLSVDLYNSVPVIPLRSLPLHIWLPLAGTERPHMNAPAFR